MTRLLVSVRSVEEAAAALAGGAAIIDIKEPARGSLGRADDAVIEDILRFVAERRPVSAAQGELSEDIPAYSGLGLSFVKWGLAGCQRDPEWAGRLEALRQRTASQVVFVAYADWQCAQAPPLDDIAALACGKPGNVLLLDTHCKDVVTLKKDCRPTLLDWLSVPDIVKLCENCRAAGVQIALAGSLGSREIGQLRHAEPNWFAVRGAACAGHAREGMIQEQLVRSLVQLLQ